VSQAGATGLYQRSNNRRRGTGDELRGWGTGDGTTAETVGKLISLGVPRVVRFFTVARRPSPVARPPSPVPRPRQSSAYASPRDDTYTSR